MARVILTESGFRFGAMIVEATTSIERSPGKGEHTVITIITSTGQRLEVYCSPSGRSLRVFKKGKGELTPS